MFRNILVIILISFCLSPAHGQEASILGSAELFGRNIGSDVLLPAQEFDFASKKLSVPASQYQWQLETQLSDALKDQGIVPNANAFSVLYSINGVNSLSELIGQTDIEVIERSDLTHPADPDQQIELFTSVSAKARYLANAETLSKFATNVFDPTNGDLEEFFLINQSAYSDFADAVKTDAIPLSDKFVSLLNYETETIGALQLKYVQGEALQDYEIKLLEISANDSLVRQGLLGLANPVTGGALGNGQVFVTVTLTDPAGKAVNNYRVRAVSRLNSKAVYSLGAFTSPASGSLPIATFCYFAIDPSSNQRVSDTLLHTAHSMVHEAGRPIQLAYIGPQQELASCLP